MIRIQIVLFFVGASQVLNGQGCERIFYKYLEEGSKLVSCTGNRTVEKTIDKKYFVKRCMLETNVITEFSTYQNRRLSQLSG